VAAARALLPGFIMMGSFACDLPSRHRLVEWALGRAEWFRFAAGEQHHEQELPDHPAVGVRIGSREGAVGPSRLCARSGPTTHARVAIGNVAAGETYTRVLRVQDGMWTAGAAVFRDVRRDVGSFARSREFRSDPVCHSAAPLHRRTRRVTAMPRLRRTSAGRNCHPPGKPRLPDALKEACRMPTASRLPPVASRVSPMT